MSAQTNGGEVLWEIRLAEVAGALKENGFGVDVLPSLKSAVEFFKITLLPRFAPASVAVGGSETVTRSGVYDILRAAPLEFFNPYDPALTPAQAMEARRKGLNADLFVCSSNAVTRDGRLLNLDGMGNRVASITFGPKQVVLFVGRNKICADFDAAVARIHELAAPANAIRLNRKTPCVKTGSCMNCKSPERVCASWVMTAKSIVPGRIHVLLINEDAGY